MEEAAGCRLRQRPERGEVGVVARGLPGQSDVNGVVVVVAPLRGESVAAVVTRLDHHRIVEIGFGDQGERTSQASRQCVGLLREFLQQVHGSGVDQGVHGVQPQTVDAVFLEPHAGVVEDVAAHLVLGEIDRVPPGSGRVVTQVRAEAGEHVAARTQVVVDNVLDHAKTAPVTGGHEAAIRSRTAVALLHGEPGDAVVAPVVCAVEGVDGQGFDEVDAELDEMVETLDGAVQRAVGSEGPDVQLVDHATAAGCRTESATGPSVRIQWRRVDDHAEAVDPVRQGAASRVVQHLIRVVDTEAVSRADREFAVVCPPAVIRGGEFALAARGDHQGDTAGPWTPGARDEPAHSEASPAASRATG